MRVGLDEPLEAALTREGLGRLGAIMAVDGDGRLRGIVTVDQVRQALQRCDRRDRVSRPL